MHLGSTVTADSLYEAVARGIKALQSKEWSGAGAFQIGYVDVTVDGAGKGELRAIGAASNYHRT
jgi:hypothetical protein